MMKLQMVLLVKGRVLVVFVCVWWGGGLGLQIYLKTFWRLLFVPFLHFDKEKLDRTRLMHLVMNL